MKIKLLLLSVFLLLPGFAAVSQKVEATSGSTQGTPVKPVTSDSVKKASSVKATLGEKTKGSRKNGGLFTVYQDTLTGSTQLFIRKDQLDKEFIYQSFSISGPTQLFLNQNMIRSTMVFRVRKVYDRIEFSEQNTSFYYDPENRVSRAANVDVPSAVFFLEKVVAEDSTGYLIASDGLFLSEKMDPVKPVIPPGVPPGAVFNLGGLNIGKSGYSLIRSYPENTDVVVELAYENPMPLNRGGKDITDARYNKIKIQHSLLAVPQNDYLPRRDDPRVGYFGGEVNDLTSLSATPYKDFISRWHLVKKDPAASMSEPVEPIVFWIENTTPVEFRDVVKEAGEKWNEAFEKAGFRNAIVMKMMPDTASWDPADVRYNVIRWVSSANPRYGAIGPSFYNPRTGQILGADITVEWRSAAGTALSEDLYESSALHGKSIQLPWERTSEDHAHAGFHQQHLAGCHIARDLQVQYAAGLTALEVLDEEPAKIGEMHKQFLTYLIMHEIGHTLGLNHNMKSSQMLSPAEINDLSITRTVGMIGSVMDYPAINVSLDRSKQGDYYTTKAGPYDLWAIEYGYRPFSKKAEEEGLKQILSRSTEPQLTFGNDADDMRSPGGGIDPRVMVNDLTNDMISYAEDRFKLVDIMLPKLKDRYSRPGQSYQELRNRYNMLVSQRSMMANALSRYIGGVYTDRSFPEQKSRNKPFTPVPAEIQKRALALLGKYLFAPGAFDQDAALFPYLQTQRRGFGFFGATEDIKPLATFQSMQLSILSHLLNPVTLQRVNNSTLYGNTYSSANVLADLTRLVFREDLNRSVNLYRQNLQTEFVKALSSITNNPLAQYDNASKAAALSSLKKVRTMMATAVSPDEQSKAHRTQLLFLIDKAIAIK